MTRSHKRRQLACDPQCHARAGRRRRLESLCLRATLSRPISQMKVIVLAIVAGLTLSSCKGDSNSFSSVEHILPDESSSLPNIIVLFADNLGYADVGSFSADTPSNTPNIDTYLAKEGMRLHNWNSIAHLCSASRAALLTGRYPIRTGTFPGVYKPDAKNGLSSEKETTIAKYLKRIKNHQVDSRQNNATGTESSIRDEDSSAYATLIVGKWHLGHSQEHFLPAPSHGFDEWYGIPYHMSGGSLDSHICVFDANSSTAEVQNTSSSSSSGTNNWWLPLYRNDKIVQQPVNLQTLAQRYAKKATHFIRTNVQRKRPFFLYMPFSHVHQLCAPNDYDSSNHGQSTEQQTCQWSGINKNNYSDSRDITTTNFTSSFDNAVQEMDWIAGQILKAVDASDAVKNNTFVLFTSDNGPWVAEQSCSGRKGPFAGQWLRDNVAMNCTSCPHDYIPSPTQQRPRRCVLRNYQGPTNDGETSLNEIPLDGPSMDGVHCGEDSGLGSSWEANVRMPAIARWPGKIAPNSHSHSVVSTLDVLPTILSIVTKASRVKSRTGDKTSQGDWKAEFGVERDIDGTDISPVLFSGGVGEKGALSNYMRHSFDNQKRLLFFWRDGFDEGPLPQPYGRFDVVAVKVGRRHKVWFWTKSGHYNYDPAVYHDPPLVFDVLDDPAEAYPLDPEQHKELIDFAIREVIKHKAGIDWMDPGPLTLDRNPMYIPCVNHATKCRTDLDEMPSTEIEKDSTASS